MSRAIRDKRGNCKPDAIAALIRKNQQSNETTGRAKGIRPPPKDRIMAKRNRSYKSDYYSTWCAKYDGVTKVRGSMSGA